MEGTDCSPTKQHVALNAADGMKSQELAYSFQNGIHTFSIPLLEDQRSTIITKNKRDNCSHTDSTGTMKSTKDSAIGYHMVESVSFELAPIGLSREGESITQEFTLVPTGSAAFATQEVSTQQFFTTGSLKSSVSEFTKSALLENDNVGRKRKYDYENAHRKAKIASGLLNKSGPSNVVTELGTSYKKSRNIRKEEGSQKSKLLLNNINDQEPSTSKASSTVNEELLELPCEWNDCSVEFNDLRAFMNHVSSHISEVPITEGQKGLSHGSQHMQKQIRQRRRGKSTEISLQDVDVIDEEEEERFLEESSMEDTAQDEERFYSCLWRGCGYITSSNDEIVRHINFHTFHTKLKSHGASICRETGIEPCKIGTQQRNIVPELSDPLQCQWEGCYTNDLNTQATVNKYNVNKKENSPGIEPVTFSEPLKFYWHVAWHSEEMRGISNHRNVAGQSGDAYSKSSDLKHNSSKNMNGIKTGGECSNINTKYKIACKWKDCTSKVSNVSKLKDHLRVHSQERAVACPVCGGLFTNRSKCYDHCKRQAPEEAQTFKCAYCNKKFATERLLRDHMRAHINHYKCPLCEMTCPVPSALAQHMAYRHFPIKSFSCEYEGCQYRAKTNADLRHHAHTHISDDSPDAFYHCGLEGCDFRAKAKATLKQHNIDNHQLTNSTSGSGISETSSRYVCHMCDKKFARGAYLTQHFLRIHKFRWPSGHSRFRYKKDERTGQFHLQTIRFESAELHNSQASHQQDEEDSILIHSDENDIAKNVIEGHNTESSTTTQQSTQSDFDDEDESSGYLTFNNIFTEDKGIPVGKVQGDDDDDDIEGHKNQTISGSGGLDAIIAAASVLDGNKLTAST